MALSLQGTFQYTPIGSAATVQVVKATVKGVMALSSGTRNVVNDFYFTCPLGQAMNQAMSNALMTATPGTSSMYLALQRLHSDYTAPIVQWQSLTSPLLPYFIDTTGYTGQNAVTGNRLPSFCSFCIDVGTGTHSRNAVGKQFFSPISEGDVTKDVATTGGPTTAWNAVAAGAAAVLTIVGGGSLQPIVLSNLGKTPTKPRYKKNGEVSTAWIKNFNIANGITPTDTPVPDVTGLLIYSNVVASSCSLDKYIGHMKNRQMHGRRSFSRA